MKTSDMKSELNRSLEFWNQALIQEQKSFNWETKLEKMISERMKGMIELANNIKIISDDEKEELYYIYFSTPRKASHNTRGAGRKQKVDDEIKEKIKYERKVYGSKITDLAEKYEISTGLVSKIINN